MRVVPVLLSLSLAACGISQQDHQKALDEQRKELTSNALTEKAALEAKLAEAEAAAKKANEDAKAAVAKAQADAKAEAMAQQEAAEKRIRLLTAAVRVRDAQLAFAKKAFADVERYVKEAYDSAKAAGATSAGMLSEAFDLAKQKKPATGAKLEEAAKALDAEIA